MAFHHRKFLISEPDINPKFSKKFAAETDCYMCYVCPENCYVSPPPPQLSPPPPPPPQQFSDTSLSKNHVPTVLILMLCVLGVAFLVLSYLTLARYRCRSSRSRNPEPLETSRNFLDENQGPVLDHPIWYIRTVGLPQSVIDSISSFTYRKADGLIDGHDCAVCLNDFQENEMLRLLPKCSHAFHLDCIDTWLRSHKNCPVCRAPILIAGTGVARASPVESSPSSSDPNHMTRDHDPERDELRETRPIHEDENVVSKNGSVSEARIEMARVVSDLVDHRVRLDHDLQRIRRSVSMDFSMVKNSSIYKVIMSSNSSEKGHVSMKKSFSFNGKRSLRKNNCNDQTSRLT